MVLAFIALINGLLRAIERSQPLSTQGIHIRKDNICLNWANWEMSCLLAIYFNEMNNKLLCDLWQWHCQDRQNCVEISLGLLLLLFFQKQPPPPMAYLFWNVCIQLYGGKCSFLDFCGYLFLCCFVCCLTPIDSRQSAI